MHPKDIPLLPKLDPWLDCGSYFVRNIRRQDVSERWVNWLSDPWAIRTLNLSTQVMQKKDLLDYVKRFDQRSSFLLGIFEKGTLTHVGIIRLDCDPSGKQAILNLLIGEPAHRSKGLMTQIAVSTLDHVFAKGIEKLMATTLSRNELIVAHMRNTGWQVDMRNSQQVKASTGQAAEDLCSFVLTREAWQIWKTSPLGKRTIERTKNQARPIKPK